jgi:hypothetical protein
MRKVTSVKISCIVLCFFEGQYCFRDINFFKYESSTHIFRQKLWRGVVEGYYAYVRTLDYRVLLAHVVCDITSPGIRRYIFFTNDAQVIFFLCGEWRFDFAHTVIVTDHKIPVVQLPPPPQQPTP